MTEQAEQSTKQVGAKSPGFQYRAPEAFVGTPEEAAIKIEEQNSDILADPKGHPLAAGNERHPLREHFQENRTTLFKIKSSANVNIYEEILAEAETKKAEAAEARHEEAVKLNAELVTLGFEPSGIPENLDDALLNVWRMQALSAKSDAASASNLRAMMADEKKALGNPPGISSRFESLFTEGARLKELNPEQYEKDVTNLISWMITERRAQEKLGVSGRRKDPKRFGG